MKKKVLLISIFMVFVLGFSSNKVIGITTYTIFSNSAAYDTMPDDTLLVQRLGTAWDGGFSTKEAWQESTLIGEYVQGQPAMLHGGGYESSWEVDGKTYIKDTDGRWTYYVTEDVKAGETIWFKIYYKGGALGRADIDTDSSNMYVILNKEEILKNQMKVDGTKLQITKPVKNVWYKADGKTTYKMEWASHGWGVESVWCYYGVTIDEGIYQELLEKNNMSDITIRILIHSGKYADEVAKGEDKQAHTLDIVLKNIEKSDTVKEKEQNLAENDARVEWYERFNTNRDMNLWINKTKEDFQNISDPLIMMAIIDACRKEYNGDMTFLRENVGIDVLEKWYEKYLEITNTHIDLLPLKDKWAKDFDFNYKTSISRGLNSLSLSLAQMVRNEGGYTDIELERMEMTDEEIDDAFVTYEEAMESDEELFNSGWDEAKRTREQAKKDLYSIYSSAGRNNFKNFENVLENIDYYTNNLSLEESIELSNKVSIILTVVTNIGMVLAVLISAFTGVKYMLGSVEEKADYKKDMIPYLVGAILLFGICSIVKLLYLIGTSINNT